MSISLGDDPAKHVWYEDMWKIVKSNRVNVLLVFVPFGVAAGLLELGAKQVFALNFLAIIPLAAVLSDATEALSENIGPIVGGLLNATFGNVVELIVAVVALLQGEIRIVQTGMLGSIFSNLMLVLGCSFVAGGYNHVQQTFSQTAAQTMTSMMAVSCISLLIPAAFSATVPAQEQYAVISVSRWTSVILLIIYAAYLYFQLVTHRQYFEESGEAEAEASEVPMNVGQKTCLALLAITTLAVAWCAEYLVDSIDELVTQTGLSRTFIGLILLPIVGNAAEHVTAVVMAMKNKLDLTMNVAVGSSMQIALFLTPFLVVLGWFIDVPMTLYFHTFETTVLFVSVFLTAIVLQDGESNWLEGLLLIGAYFMTAIAFFYYPDGAELSSIGSSLSIGSQAL